MSEFVLDSRPFEDIIKQYLRYIRKKTHNALVLQQNLEASMKSLNLLTLANHTAITNTIQASKRFQDSIKNNELLQMAKGLRESIFATVHTLRKTQLALQPEKRISNHSTRFPLLSELMSKQSQS